MTNSEKLARPTIDEVNIERHFELQAIFDIERSRINKHLETLANNALGAINATIEHAKEQKTSAIREVKDVFTQEERQTNNKLLGMNHELRETAPKYKSWSLWLWLAGFFGVLEVGIGVLQGIDRDGFNWFPAGIGAFLWAGGWLLGDGWGQLNQDNRIERLHEHFDVPKPQGKSRAIEWGKILIGSLIITTMSTLRSFGETGLMIGVLFSFSVVFAIGIAFFKNLSILYIKIYQWCRSRMFECQRSFATVEHKKRCEPGADYFQIYQEHVEDLARKAGTARETAPSRSAPAPPQPT
jgi:hypothetical protein